VQVVFLGARPRTCRLLPEMTHIALTIDIHCRVIDNFGDAGVTFRLARQFATMGHKARLWIDDASAVRALWNDPWPAGVDVVDWDHALPCGDVVIEAFGCALPAWRLGQIRALAGRGRPVWINLEYLSAQAWVDDIHGMPSPDPVSGSVKTFFCPGFSKASGGVVSSDVESPSWRNADDPVGSILVFGYPAPIWSLWTNAWTHWGVTNIRFAAPEIDHPSVKSCAWVRQDQFDTLLNEHDVVVVRGEDSFVRAQLLGVPMLWHIYPTSDLAHLAKLYAWLDRYLEQAPHELGRVVRALHVQLNDTTALTHNAEFDWHRAFKLIAVWREHARAWSSQLRSQKQCPDLATGLVEYCLKRLQ
jgi:hypothetical protein